MENETIFLGSKSLGVSGQPKSIGTDSAVTEKEFVESRRDGGQPGWLYTLSTLEKLYPAFLVAFGSQPLYFFLSFRLVLISSLLFFPR